MFQKIILVVIPTIFLSVSLFGAQEVIVRPQEVDLTQGSSVSDIPYGYYTDSLTPQMLKVIDSLNMRGEEGKRLFVGYGVYDKNEKNCKYLDTGITQHDFDLKFHKLKTFNGHSYAISRNKMSLSQCQALTSSFSGKVFTPGNYVENQSVIGRKSSLYEDGGWLGIYRQSCSADYTNLDDSPQTFKNFWEAVDNCEVGKLYTYKKENSSLWWKGNSSTPQYCIIEIDSEEVTRPVKVCAPWWRIERNYKLPPQDKVLINGVSLDLYSINQATLPMRMTTCLEYADDVNSTALPDRNIICHTYYDMTMAPECRGDIFQPQCFIDTCEGYTKNVCSKNEIQPSSDGKVKDYIWGYVRENGQNVRVKIKQKMRSYAYTCPPGGTSVDKCLLAGDVVVFPYQCDAAVCSDFKRCLGDKSKSRTQCHTLYPCEEVYGESSSPVLENGKLVGFRAKCGERSVVNRNIETLSKKTDKCVKYKKIIDVVTETKKCTDVATERNYEVNATITEPDIYLGREDCVRHNDVENARPKINLTFDYINKGFFNLALMKSYHDDTSELNITESNNSIAHDLQYMILKKETLDSNVTVSNGSNGICQTKFDSLWNMKRIGAYAQKNNDVYFGDLNPVSSGLLGVSRNKHTSVSKCRPNEVDEVGKCFLDANDNSIADANLTSCPGGGRYTLTASKKCSAPYVVDYELIAVTSDKAYASQLSSDMGLSNDVGGKILLENYDLGYMGIDGSRILSGELVVLGGNEIKGDDYLDRFRLVPHGGSFVDSFINADSGTRQMKGSDCKIFAKCNDFYVTSAYNNDNEMRVCKVSSDPSLEDLNPAITHHSAGYPEYNEIHDVLATSIDGMTDIFSIQEYADGKFGYASNFHFLLPKNNEVYLEGKEVFPMVPQYALDKELDYTFRVSQRTQRVKNKDPYVQQGSYEGVSISADDVTNVGLAVGAGVGLAVGLASTLAYGGPVGIVIGVIIILFASQVKYGDLDTNWKITDEFPERYKPNVYGYDLRIVDNDKTKITYVYEHLKTPTAEDDDFEKMLSDHEAGKRANLYWMGYEKSIVDDVLLRPCEKGVCGGYPSKIKWYKFRKRKVKTTVDGENTVPVIKQINNVYLGATNTVSIFVPYLGDYVVTAYSATDNILSQVIISSDDFLQANARRMSYAKVSFGSSALFTLAPGIEAGTSDNACTLDDALEWGGGVSGIYYEEHTPQGNICAKSNDSYVQSNYASYITVKPVKANKAFRVKLLKPMPYANRVSLITYGKRETRKYTCYEKGAPCTVE
jgi:hypothetical protein